MNITKLTIHEAAELLRKKKISSVDLTKESLNQVSKVDPKIKSFITVTENVALQQAQKADVLISLNRQSHLTGIPMQLKDNICTKGIPTTCSSRMLKNFIPPYDSTVYKILKNINGVLIGKGNLDEFAMGSSTENSAFFTTHNPWDFKRVPGGSSGGPAASVASGQVLYSLGSDTGGSIRQPASLCGVVGLKPTYGLVSRYGLIAFASSLDQIGPITKDVTDSALVLRAIAGHDPHDSTSSKSVIPDYTKSLTGKIKGLRLGIPKEYFVDGMESGVKNSIDQAIKVLTDLGASVEETSLPHTKYALYVYYIIAPSEASANLARYDGVKYGFSIQNTSTMWEAMENTKGQGFGPEVKRRIMLGTYALSAGYYDAYYLKALKVRTIIRQEFIGAFKKFDALVTPTSPTTAFNIGERIENPLEMYLSDICTIPANIAGLPAISIPAGFSNGLPVGIQFIAPHFGEETLFKLAYAYEQSTGWHARHPRYD